MMRCELRKDKRNKTMFRLNQDLKTIDLKISDYYIFSHFVNDHKTIIMIAKFNYDYDQKYFTGM